MRCRAEKQRPKSLTDKKRNKCLWANSTKRFPFYWLIDCLERPVISPPAHLKIERRRGENRWEGFAIALNFIFFVLSFKSVVSGRFCCVRSIPCQNHYFEAFIINKMLQQSYDEDIEWILSERANHNKFLDDFWNT